MTRAGPFLALVVSLGFAGCGPPGYQIHGHSFHSFEDAAAYVRAKNEELYANVQPLPALIAGPALVIVPTRIQIERAARVAAPIWDDRQIQQFVELSVPYNYSYRIIERRNIFQSVQHIEAESPEGVEVPHHGYLIWYEWRTVGYGADVHIVAAGEAQRTMIQDGAAFLDERDAAQRLLPEIESYVKTHPATG